MSPYRLHPQACGKEGPQAKEALSPRGIRPSADVGNWLSEDVIFGSALSKHEGAKLGTMGFSVCCLSNKRCHQEAQALGFRADQIRCQPQEPTVPAHDPEGSLPGVPTAPQPTPTSPVPRLVLTTTPRSRPGGSSRTQVIDGKVQIQAGQSDGPMVAPEVTSTAWANTQLTNPH